jgi:hypothetical protein
MPTHATRQLPGSCLATYWVQWCARQHLNHALDCSSTCSAGDFDAAPHPVEGCCHLRRDGASIVAPEQCQQPPLLLDNCQLLPVEAAGGACSAQRLDQAPPAALRCHIVCLQLCHLQNQTGFPGLCCGCLGQRCRRLPLSCALTLLGGRLASSGALRGVAVGGLGSAPQQRGHPLSPQDPAGSPHLTLQFSSALACAARARSALARSAAAAR